MFEEHSIHESIHEQNYEIKSEPEDDVLAVFRRSETASVDMVSVLEEYKPNIPQDDIPDSNDNDDSDHEHSVEYFEEENPITE